MRICRNQSPAFPEPRFLQIWANLQNVQNDGNDDDDADDGVDWKLGPAIS